MTVTSARIAALERLLEESPAPGRLVLISSTAWPAADREAFAAAQGSVRRDVAAPDVAQVRHGTMAGQSIIERRTGLTRPFAVLDVPPPDAMLALPDDAREAWLDQHETRSSA